MNSFYATNAAINVKNPPQNLLDRAAALQSALTLGDPTGGAVTAFPAVVVVSSAIDPQVIPDDTGQATAAQVQAAQQAATQAETTHATNAATIRTNVASHQTQIQAWIAANPNGALLTAGQTLALARMLNGLCQLLLEQFTSTTAT